MKVIGSVLVLFLMSVTAFAADVDGTWTGSVAAPQGEIPVMFNFKADGAKLTGSTTGLDGNPVAISDGKIDGSTITFGVTLDLGGIPLAMSYKGAVSADQIKMSADVAGVPFEFVVKKAKPAAVDGTWTGSVGSPQGEIPVTFNFKSDGAKLTGTTTGLDGAPVPISDGKIDGSSITFSVSFDFGGMPFAISYKGAVSADQIKMSADAAGMPIEFELKRSKP